jgi:hypothetical protein
MAATTSENAFIGLPLLTLQSLQTAYHTAILEVVTTGQTYALEGRSRTSADLSELKKTLREISDAITALTIPVRRFARPIFRQGSLAY